ncbi:MAG TPA: CHAP domain-containing protein, partial [Acidimicrobiia bacterium]
MARMPYLHPGRRSRLVGATALLASLSIVALGPVPAPAFATSTSVTAGDLGYPYPNAPDCNEQTGANCVGDQWGFVQGQCHSWVAYRINELNATELQGVTFTTHYRQPSGQTWGSVWHWGIAAAAAGITVDDTPALGSLAWWSDNGGHVGYVEAVNADGTVSMSEMNYDLHNGFDFATLQRGVRWPTGGFIHVADRPAVNTPAAPTNVTATAGRRRARVSWTVPADNGSPITGYRVTASPGGTTVSAGPGATSKIVRGLTKGTSYTFTVYAINANGNG